MDNYGLKDIPIEKLEDESLGIQTYAESLHDFILRCETPMTVAIQGDWGSGKTSLMQIIKSKLENNANEKKVETIWFNTWQFSQFGMQDDLAISLLSHFVDAISNDEQKNKAGKILNGLKMAGKFGVKAITDMYYAGTLAEKVGEVFSDAKDPAKEIKELKVALENNVNEKLTKDGNDRIVVFIDDLDRLLPEKAVDLLEVFKLFLDIPGCVFILACDYEVVSKGLEKKFGIKKEDLKGRSFFDKIIQLPFSMPVSQYDIKCYFEKLLSNIGIDFEDQDIDSYIELVNGSVGFNPRGMKRLFNLMLLLDQVARKKSLYDGSDGVEIRHKQRVLFGILCLQTSYEAIYNYILEGLPHNLSKVFDATEVFELDEGLEEDEKKKILELFKIKESDGEAFTFDQAKSFMSAFHNCIQLDEDAEISSEELNNLCQIFYLSAITSIDFSSFTKKIGYSQKRADAEQFLRDINEKYANYLEGNKFQFRQPRGESELRVSLLVNKLRGFNNFRIVFLLSKDQIEAFFAGKPRAFSQWKEKFDDYFSGIWPDRNFDQFDANEKKKNKIVVLWKEPIDGNKDDTFRTNLFQEEVTKTLDIVIPKIFSQT